MDTAILSARSPEILPYIRLKIVTASVTILRRDFRNLSVNQEQKKSESYREEFFNRLMN